MSNYRVVVSISYGAESSEQATRTQHLGMYHDVKIPEEAAKTLADSIAAMICSIKKDNKEVFGMYKEEFPATVNPNPQVN